MVRTFLALGSAAVVAASWGTPAHAGTYTHHLCADQDGKPVPSSGLAAVASGEGAEVIGQCSDTGMTASIVGPTSAASSATLSYTAPADTVITAVSGDRSYHATGEYGMRYSSFYEEPSSCNWDQMTACARSPLTWSGTTDFLYFRVTCPDSGCGTPDSSDTQRQFAAVTVQRLAITLADAVVPRFDELPTGPLVNPAAKVRGIARASFRASDLGGGLREQTLMIDGVPLVQGPVGIEACGPPYVRAVPCPLSAKSVIEFDSTRVSDGLHSVQIVLTDATGANSAASEPVQIRVENFSDAGHLTGSSQRQPNGAGASAAARIRPGKASSTPVRRVRAGRAVRAGGVLEDSRGQAISGATLQVFSTLDVPGAKERLLLTTTTNPAGRFSFVVPPGRSRKVRVAYRAFTDDRRDSASWTFAVAVRAPLTLKASDASLNNGDTLTLTARLLDGRRLARRADIAFQVRIGSQWRTFATRELDGRGRAKVVHRFRVTYHRMTYRFRAVTLGKRAFPYANGISRTVAVRLN